MLLFIFKLSFKSFKIIFIDICIIQSIFFWFRKFFCSNNLDERIYNLIIILLFWNIFIIINYHYIHSEFVNFLTTILVISQSTIIFYYFFYFYFNFLHEYFYYFIRMWMTYSLLNSIACYNWIHLWNSTFTSLFRTEQYQESVS